MKRTRSKHRTLTGLHILGEIFTKRVNKLINLKQLESFLSKLLKNKDLNQLGKCGYKFKDAGFSLVINLVESHISIHSWPELECVTIDVFLCNYFKDNSKLCDEIFNHIAKYFCPYKIKKRSIHR